MELLRRHDTLTICGLREHDKRLDEAMFFKDVFNCNHDMIRKITVVMQKQSCVLSTAL